MAKSDLANSYAILGVVFACVGVLILLLTLLDYLQDGKTESSILLVAVVGILLGVFLYSNGKRSKAQDK